MVFVAWIVCATCPRILRAALLCYVQLSSRKRKTLFFFRHGNSSTCCFFHETRPAAPPSICAGATIQLQKPHSHQLNHLPCPFFLL